MMRLSERELYHGAALTRILEGAGFRSIRKASALPGHYEVNGNVRVLMRYSGAGIPPWRFTLRDDELAVLRKDRTRRAFLCLVCKDELVCVLTAAQVGAVIDLEAEASQSIRIYSRRGSSIEARAASGSSTGGFRSMRSPESSSTAPKTRDRRSAH